jgi:hypothetical protein
MPLAAADFEYVRGTGLIDQLIADRYLVGEKRVAPGALGPLAEGAHCVLEHPRLAFISYPYEWTFSGLKAAALHHLDIHLRALARDVTLSDASAYNIQFLGFHRSPVVPALSPRRVLDRSSAILPAVFESAPAAFGDRHRA